MMRPIIRGAEKRLGINHTSKDLKLFWYNVKYMNHSLRQSFQYKFICYINYNVNGRRYRRETAQNQSLSWAVD